jgi:hypothetical protein
MLKLRFITVLFLALAAGSYSSAQQQSLPAHFGNWSGQVNAQWVETEAPLNYVKLWKESGRTTGEYCEYSSGQAKISVSLEKYRDPSSAYAAYTAYIRPNMLPSTLNRTSAVDGDRLFVLVGSFVLEVRPIQSISTADLVALVDLVSARSDKTPLPPIRGYLPRGFTDGTQKYALGPDGFRVALETLGRGEYSLLAEEAGFNSGAEAMLGQYLRGKDSAVLLLIDYPTPQLAEQHLRHLEQALSASANLAGTKIEREGSLLSLVLAPTSMAFADEVRNAIRYGTQVTWNEPHQTLTDPPLLSTISTIFIVTGVFMLVAVVLGVAFGGVRLLAKVLFPGKVFDRPEQMDVLQLGLSSKRIDSRDFY